MSPHLNLSCVLEFFLRYILLSAMYVNTVWTIWDNTDMGDYGLHPEFDPLKQCPYFHHQEYYCNSDFVIKAKLVDALKIGGGRYRVDRVFKEICLGCRHKMRKDDQVTIFVNILAQKFPLKVGEVYLLAGSNRYGYLHVRRCDLIARWENITSMQERGLVTGEDDAMSCRCKIEPAYVENKLVKDERKDKFVCDMIHPIDMPSEKSLDCYEKYARCIKGRSGCRWEVDDQWASIGCPSVIWPPKMTGKYTI